MKRYCFWIVFALLFFNAVHGCKKSNTSIGGGETNWLTKCISDLDCSDGVSCECGICTKSCESSDDCSEVPGAAGCLVTETLDDGTCRVAFAGESDRGICVARCETDSDCNEGSDFKCISGVCVAIIEEKQSDAGDAGTRYGLVFPVTDAGGSYPLGLNESADAEASAINSNVEQDGLNIVPEDANAGENNVLGPVLESPFPQCPCSVDIAQGTRAPKLSDYSPNAYGQPEFYASSFFTRSVPTNCWSFIDHSPDDPNSYFPEPNPYQGLQDLCLVYILCVIGCDKDADCPNVGSGSSVARCSSEGECYLDCDFGRSCPDGMTCVQGLDGASCFWAQKSGAPGCPGYCEQGDVPPDCQTSCASLLVACDPDKGSSCCEGLVCAAEGYCVQQ